MIGYDLDKIKSMALAMPLLTEIPYKRNPDEHLLRIPSFVCIFFFLSFFFKCPFKQDIFSGRYCSIVIKCGLCFLLFGVIILIEFGWINKKG